MFASLKKILPLTIALGTIILSTGLVSPYILGSLRAQPVQTRVVIIGDSIVAGHGDTEEFKGLTGRLNKRGSLQVETIGLPGATTKGLSMYLQHQLSRDSPLRNKVIEADVVILSSGLNDFWSEAGPKRTANNLRRLIKFIRCTVETREKRPQKFSVATLGPTTLPAQASWSEAVNNQIIQFPSEEVFVGPRLNELPKSLLGDDGIHPSPEGYAWIAERTSSFITKLPVSSTPVSLDCSDKHLLGLNGTTSLEDGDTSQRKRARRPVKKSES